MDAEGGGKSGSGQEAAGVLERLGEGGVGEDEAVEVGDGASDGEGGCGDEVGRVDAAEEDAEDGSCGLFDDEFEEGRGWSVEAEVFGVGAEGDFGGADGDGAVEGLGFGEAAAAEVGDAVDGPRDAVPVDAVGESEDGADGGFGHACGGVGVEGAACDIAGCEDVGGGGAHGLVDADALGGGGDARAGEFFEVEARGSACGEDDGVGVPALLGRRCAEDDGAVLVDAEGLAGGEDADLGGEVAEVDADEVGVAGGEDAGAGFEDEDFGACEAEEGGVFESCGACSDDGDAGGGVVPGEGGFGCEAGGCAGEVGDEGDGSCGDEDVAWAEGVGADEDGLAVEAGLALEEGDVAEGVAEVPSEGFEVGAEAREGGREVEGFFGLGAVEEGLEGDAAVVEAGAAECGGLDEDGVEAVAGGHGGGGESCGSCADDEEVGFGHDGGILLRGLWGGNSRFLT